MNDDIKKMCIRLSLREKLEEIGINSTFNQRKRLRFYIMALLRTERENYYPSKKKPRRDLSVVCTLTREEINNIIKDAAKMFNRTVEQIKSPSRKKEDAYARHAITYVLYNKFMTYKSIGKKLNRKNHTTIMASYNVINTILTYNKTCLIDLEKKAIEFVLKYVDYTLDDKDMTLNNNK
jgi:hypothetical protein